ncbi:MULTISPECIES: HAMP domain-containing sensor histidine kinase [Dehalobacter]|jgi:signal transduction histidine kinase|uniref:histidine kinase n=2 Tax=Dehalobacter restrictus TaxID=55583 RepID=A0A857DEZ1_9FIRM|nr:MULTISPECIES: HAMP domain-containing sensor histidine kinase [Dehalobacter]AHF09298.1 histidine kinase [Dehalobacter restrictus DSM 9455]MCG1025252.1 two-component sensor histidine kinase [Dehalobacter sp.]MDJ0305843.1 MFS domain-containing histidine kinase [Dehalobacter sp.]OCZ52292.1 two-component sensor histidine kinase [Dehalobacter sp. TeCB1]QGZ99833.1 two-component sensor histidine kinase [Dehalobacter restrictus]
MKQPKRPKRPPAAIALISFILAFGCFFSAGYGLVSLIYRWTGTPSQFWVSLIASLTGMILFIGAAFIFRWITIRRTHSIRQHRAIHDQLLNAMTRIAQGDFDVFIDTQDAFIYDDIAEGINKIAKELGSMEQLRQDFISNISHEIQSPLTSISGFAALLKNDTLTDAQRNHYLGIIEAESKRLSALSDNLLKLSVLETGVEPLSFKEYRLDKQLADVALMLEPQWCAKNIAMEADLEKVMIQGDEGLLSQVWVNLLHNAVKFTPEGGVIRVVLQADQTDVCCLIADTGIGIASEDQIHIFERFYKVDKARERALGGNGLGLSLAKKIVELHGGHITTESAIGKGTTFTITLPRHFSH